MNNNKFTINKLSKYKNKITIKWKDKKISNFHFLWLRDNCPSSQHPHARQRTFNLLDVSEKIFPKKIFINQRKNIEIHWSEGNHISYFSAEWLRNHCYTIKNKNAYRSPYILWNKKLQKNLHIITLEYKDIISSDKALTKWLENLHVYGFALIRNSPTKKNSALKILNKISHIRETFFGTPFEVFNIPQPNNTAYTSDGLRNHTDLPYYEYAPGYQFLHCLINNAKGGYSLAVDGFNVADYLKNYDPKTFKTLLNTHVKFKDNDYTQKTIRIFHSPLITLNKDKDFNDIRFSIATMGAMDCHPKKMVEFYKAYRKFAKLLHQNKFMVKFKLKSGDIFSFNNRRILHGRTSYNTNSGNRHLQGYYIDRDDILGRLNYLKKIKV